MNITPRKYKRDISWVNCGACVAACNKELGAGKGLFTFGVRTGTNPPAKLQWNYAREQSEERVPPWHDKGELRTLDFCVFLSATFNTPQSQFALQILRKVYPKPSLILCYN
jgi:hypothetical protein